MMMSRRPTSGASSGARSVDRLGSAHREVLFGTRPSLVMTLEKSAWKESVAARE
jgi:hypothetical protein